ncbi:MAG: acyltransferase family protein, partial [Ruminococcus sp.]|nr:acyltransferase family protein [Ruminococcus sp.]
EIYFKNGIIRGISYIVVDFLGLYDLFSTPTMNGTWWYMSAALIFIVFVPIAEKFTKSHGYTPLIIFLMIIPRILDLGYLNGTNPYTFLIIVLSGMLFAQYDVFDRVLNIKLVKNKVADKIIQFILWTALLALSIYMWIRLQQKYYWEYHFVLQPLISIIYCRKYIIRLPIIRSILELFGKHSMNIFLVHTFIRYTFFADFTYSFKYFWLIGIVLLSISLLISICLQLLKKLFCYDTLMNKLSIKIINVLNR